MRYAFIKTLTAEAEKNKNIILITGDLGFTVFEEFKQKFPKQFLNVGVAEQNMMGIAAGLALSGKTVFVYSIATFASMRAYEQIRNDIASHQASVIVVGTGGGLSYGHLSITHHSIEDIALMRVIPGMNIICPADPTETTWATKLCIKMKKPMYLRLGKKGEPGLYKKTPNLKFGKGSILKTGGKIAILATGNMVHTALVTSEILLQKKISATVVSMHTIKPIDRTLILRYAKKYPIIATIEEHSIIGGLGSATAEILSEYNSHARLIRFGVPDILPFEIGSQEYLRKKLSLAPGDIARKILSTRKQKYLP